MRRPAIAATLAASLALASGAVSLAADPVDWRIGFEWNENWPWSPGWDDPALATLLDELAATAPGGGINVNGGFTWAALQPTAGSPLQFATADQVVRLFQEHGFELTWYFTTDARWAWVDPDADVPLGTSMAPSPAHEADWQNLVRAVVERYDGDGTGDMPGLARPVRFYILPGEIRYGKTGEGDAEPRPFWADSVANLLRLHRLTYAAVHQADPSGATKVVGSGALLWDLYADFPDYPAFDPDAGAPTVAARLSGANFAGSDYRAGWAELRQMLASFGDDGDGVECDYVGWHPHFSWRGIDQEFAWIRSLTHGKPIYVDDMWTNLFAVGYPAIPGEAQFNATPSPAAGWVARLWGDFPNPLFPGSDPYTQLTQKLTAGDAAAHAWYRAKGAHELVAAIATAFGEGAERVSYSGTNDTALFGIFRAWELGWINLLGTVGEGYAEKPQTHALAALAAELADFTSVARLAVSADPRTRAYRFERPRGALTVAWSETGAPPAGLDYDAPTGETVDLPIPSPSVRVLHLPDEDGETAPSEEPATPVGGVLRRQLGYAPILLAEEPATGCTPGPTTLCLEGGRFRATVRWRDFLGGTGDGHAQPITTDSGLFWFFAPTNLEMLIKVLDGCGVNGHHWVYAAATTDVEYTLTVTDTRSGAEKLYLNALGIASPAITDSSAFATCP
jgi:hypothetical protein